MFTNLKSKTVSGKSVKPSFAASVAIEKTKKTNQSRSNILMNMATTMDRSQDPQVSITSESTSKLGRYQLPLKKILLAAASINATLMLTDTRVLTFLHTAFKG